MTARHRATTIRELKERATHLAKLAREAAEWAALPLAERTRLTVEREVLEAHTIGTTISIWFMRRTIGGDVDGDLLRALLTAELSCWQATDPGRYHCAGCHGTGEKTGLGETYVCGTCRGTGEHGRPRVEDLQPGKAA